MSVDWRCRNHDVTLVSKADKISKGYMGYEDFFYLPYLRPILVVTGKI